MKSRAYRRYMEDVIVLRRMKNHIAHNSWWEYTDINHITKSEVSIKDIIRSSHKDRKVDCKP